MRSPVLFVPRSSRSLQLLSLLLAAAAIFWICTYKIMDRDFWWHITAGRVLLTSGWITVDPFAYTREGLPYLATHEWLAQIILYLIYKIVGSTGIILFRGVIACAATGILLLLSRQLRITNVALAVWAVVMMKGSFLERPQLFTFVFFSLFLFLAFRFLDAESLRKRLWIGVAWIIAELLWVNMHGGAALLGCAIVGFVFVQQCWNALWIHDRLERRTCVVLAGILALMAVTLVLPPNGFETISYVTQLTHDQTIAFIAEWQPRSIWMSLGEIWIFGLLAIVALATARRYVLFNGLVLLMGAYLSRQAFRHEILFVLTALATFYYQAEFSEWINSIYERLRHARRSGVIVGMILLLFMTRVAYVRSMNFERPDHLFGFGQFDLARGAVDFLEKEQIMGKMFNTYGIGGYLIHRGYPERKVFIDGRNVDYGFDFMMQAYTAGLDAAAWRKLVDRYGVTYALIDYNAIREADSLPYSSIVDRNPEWALVYIDDGVAVYLKKIPANQPSIDRWQLNQVTATELQFDDSFGTVNDEDAPALRAELQRIQSDNPEGVKATVALGKLALRQGDLAAAREFANTAVQVRPQFPEPYELLAAVSVAEGQWNEAADAYINLLARAGDRYPDLNYDYIAGIFAKAGYGWRAWWYGAEELVSPEPVAEPTLPVVQTGAVMPTDPKAPSLSVDPAGDAVTFNAQGVDQAAAGALESAEESFRMAMMMNPSYIEAWSNLCALLYQRENLPEAIAACERAIELNPEYGDPHYNLALVYFDQGNFDAAQKEAEQAQKFGRESEGEALLKLIEAKNR